jgi:hypothetical protein
MNAIKTHPPTGDVEKNIRLGLQAAREKPVERPADKEEKRPDGDSPSGQKIENH